MSWSGVARLSEELPNSLSQYVIVADFAFPNYKTAPTKLTESGLIQCIPRYVASKFWLPVILITARCFPSDSTVMPVPETAVDEYYLVAPREG